MLAAVLFDQYYKVTHAAIVPREVVEQNSSYQKHTNSHRFILRDNAWSWHDRRDERYQECRANVDRLKGVCSFVRLSLAIDEARSTVKCGPATFSIVVVSGRSDRSVKALRGREAKRLNLVLACRRDRQGCRCQNLPVTPTLRP